MLAGILLVAALLRLWDVGTLPPGLYRDEAFNGLDAQRVLQGRLPLYFPANNGREPLFVYLQAPFVALLGPSTLALRLPAALSGLATVPATYLLGRALYGPLAGLLGAWVVAVTFWPVALSRIGLRAVALPLLAALFLWLALRAWERPSRPGFVAAGLLLGLTAYTYPAARLIPLALLLVLAHLLWRGRRLPRQAWLLPGTALLVTLPLFLAAGNEALLRPGQVSIFNPDIHHGDPLGLVLRHVGAILGMWFVRGDAIARHNLPGRAVFDPLLGVALVLGVAVALRRFREPRYALPLVWTAVLVLPSLLAEDAPHFLRAAGVLPVALLLPALGLRWLAARGWPAGRRYGALLVTPFLVWPLVATSGDYLGRYARLESVYHAFDGAYRSLAEEGRAFAGQVYVSPELASHPTVRYLLPQASIELNEGPAMLILWPHQDIREELARLPSGFVVAHHQGRLLRGDKDPQPALLYEVFSADEGDILPLRPEARFVDGIHLGRALVWPQTAENALQVSLFWETEGPSEKDYTVFVHVLDAASGRLLGQHDGPPLDGRFPTSWWRAGDTYEDVHRVPLPGNYDASSHKVIAGLYDPLSGQRLLTEDGRDFVVLDEPEG